MNTQSELVDAINKIDKFIKDNFSKLEPNDLKTLERERSTLESKLIKHIDEES